MATMIADTACIDPRADIADDVEIGPYCVIGPDVMIGRGTRLIAHVCLVGHTTLGENNVVHPFAVIGGEPQDYLYKGQPTRVEIGDNNVFRESVTIHRGSDKEDGLTRVGSNNYLMANVHVGHDCVLGDRILVANNSMFAGHIHVESFANISAPSDCTSSSGSAPIATSAACRESSTTCPLTCSLRETPRKSAVSTWSV